jgi:hypothetical protein
MAEKFLQIKDNIERLEVMEEKFGITFEGINAIITYNDSSQNQGKWLKIYLEVHSKDGCEIDNDILINAVAFDSEGVILGKTVSKLSKDKFFILDCIEIHMFDLMTIPTKIRIYPQLG